MINNVKSFPPEWDKFDSNNFGGDNDAETLNLLIEEDMLPAVHNADGAIMTDQNGNICSLSTKKP